MLDNYIYIYIEREREKEREREMSSWSNFARVTPCLGCRFL